MSTCSNPQPKRKSILLRPLAKTLCQKNPFSKKLGRRYRQLVLEHRDAPIHANPLDNLISYLLYKLFGKPRDDNGCADGILGEEAE
jgi:hypothetical protein